MIPSSSNKGQIKHLSELLPWIHQLETTLQIFKDQAIQTQPQPQPRTQTQTQSHLWTSLQNTCSQVCLSLQKFQERPELLDPVLSQLVGALCDWVTTALWKNRHGTNVDHQLDCECRKSQRGSLGNTGGTESTGNDGIASNHEAKANNTIGSDMSKVVLKVCACECVTCSLDPVFHTLYHITKIRGAKNVIKCMHHDSDLLTHVVNAYIDASTSGAASSSSSSFSSFSPPSLSLSIPYTHTHWQYTYILSIWLCTLLLIPFDLRTLLRKEQDPRTLFEVGKRIMEQPGKTREGASYMMARLLVRSDCKTLLHEFISWAVDTVLTTSDSCVTGSSASAFLKLGVLQSMSEICKVGSRNDILLAFTSRFGKLMHVLTQQYQNNASTMLDRLYVIKLTQRMALLLVPETKLSWAYHRKRKQLFDKGEPRDASLIKHDGTKNREQYKQDLALLYNNLTLSTLDRLEDITDIMLRGLGDRDTRIRWSAAKGIGRITNRLPAELGPEVVLGVLRLFYASTQEINLRLADDAIWHGGCLAIAELVRHGLVLPEARQYTKENSTVTSDMLSAAVEIVISALQFDMLRGNSSVGAHVRDAACYCCWSFARAYSPSDLVLHGKRLANALLPVILFDREVNCRRAASAAFQECVGRLGEASFCKHGIDIVRHADFFSLGDRAASYTRVTKQIVVLDPEAYIPLLLNDIWERRGFHWDIQIRLQAAESIREIFSSAIECNNFSISAELNKYIKCAVDSNEDPNIQHGALLCVSALFPAYLADLERSGSQPMDETMKVIEKVYAIPSAVLSQLQMTKAMSSDMIRIAGCRVVETCVLCSQQYYVNRPETPLTYTSRVVEFVMYCSQFTEGCQLAALSAFSCLCRSAWAPSTEKERWISSIVSGISSERAAGGLSKESLRGKYRLLGAIDQHMNSGSLDLTLLDSAVRCLVEVTGAPTDAFVSSFSQSSNASQPALTGTALFDVEAARNGASSLASVLCFADIAVEQVLVGLKALECGMCNYAVDNRGDVGSWVRRQCMISFAKLAEFWVESQSLAALLHVPEFRERLRGIMAQLIRQLCERMDQVRQSAFECLKYLVLNGLASEIWPEVQIKPIVDFISESGTHASVEYFLRIGYFLSLEESREACLLGLIASIGSIGLESQAASSAFEQIMNKPDNPNLRMETVRAILRIHEQRLGGLRLVTATLKTMERFVCKDIPSWLQADDSITKSWVWDEIGPRCATLVRHDARNCRDPARLATITGILSELIKFGAETYALAAEGLMLLLVHPLPCTRKDVAEGIYTFLISVEEDMKSSDEDALPSHIASIKVQDALELLLATSWDAASTSRSGSALLDELRCVRDQLCDCLGVRKPRAVAK